MVKIVPSILAKDATSFEEDLKKVWGLVDRVQFDIVDGKFAPLEWPHIHIHVLYFFYFVPR